MKTSTYFACGVPETEQELHSFLYPFIEKEFKFKADYGLKKIFNPFINEYIGVAGLIRSSNQFKGYDNILTEVTIFLKPKYIGKKFGLIAEGMLSKRGEELNNVHIASVWEENAVSIALIEKYGGIFMGTIEKNIKGKTVKVKMYAKFPKSIEKIPTNICIQNFLITKRVA